MRDRLLGAVFLLLIGGGLYWFARTSLSTVAPLPPPHEVKTQTLQTRAVPPGAREYRTTRYGFSVLYPESMQTQQYREGDATTITFQSANRGQGFQIFVTPYRESQVSERRFRMDVPSGVQENLTQIEVDGVVGASFYSIDVGLGDTYEVWFIHNGFLFEITTLRPLEPLIKEILTTWEFL